MTTPTRPLPLYKTVLFVTCIAILLGSAYSQYSDLRLLRAANAEIELSWDVKNRLQSLNALIVDAENDTRAYFLSGNAAYLDSLRAAPARMDAEFARLSGALRGATAQERNLAQLRTLLQRKIAGLNQDVAVYRQGGLADVAARADGRDLLDEIRLQVVIMAQEQSALERARSQGFYARYQQAVAAGIAINTLAIAVLVLFYRSIRRTMSGMLKAEDGLQRANATLEQTVASRTERLSVLSQHLLHVQEEEKARLARELHDELGAALTAIGMDLDSVAGKLRERDPVLAKQLARARGSLLQAIDVKRQIVEDLRPSMLDNLGLAAALEHYCGNFADVTGIRVNVDVPDLEAIDPSVAIVLFRIAQESLNNVAKYARASRVAVTLAERGKALALTVADDGVGIGEDALDKPLSHGLMGMRERTSLVGGTFAVRRGEGGKGTVVEAVVPLPDIEPTPDFDEPWREAPVWRPPNGAQPGVAP